MGRGIVFEFESDIDNLSDFLGGIGERYVPSEAAKALNRTQTFVKKEIAEEVSRRTGLRVAAIKRRLKTIKRQRANPRKLTVGGFVGEEVVSVSKLTPKPRRVGRGVRYAGMTGQPPKPNAFYGVMKSGKASAWYRTTSRRTPIKEVQYDIKIHLRRSVRSTLATKSRGFLNKTFEDNMQKRLQKEAAKRGIAVQ